jgi:DNA-binding response OmpR family regulator
MAGETVLIIEDRRENIVHLANNVLKPNGYQVITAMDGQRGLRRVLSDKPDLIILDLNLPKMDGLEVLKALRERQVDTPVILTTFYGSEQVAEQALSLGAVDYIVKPYDFGEMLAATQKALARRPPPPQPAPAKPEKVLDEIMPLTRQVERWVRDMNILNRVGKALVALLDLERVCIRTVEAAIYVTRSDYSFLYLEGEESKTGLYLRATRGPHDRRARLLDQPVDSGLATQVARTGEIVLGLDAAGDVKLFEVAGEALGPVAAVPVHWQRSIIGVLMVARSRGEPAFNEADVEWLSGLADYAAIAVHNAQAYQQRAQSPPELWLDEERLTDWRHEIDQLTEGLQAASSAAKRLAALLEGNMTPD